jgi:hypothetical protein
MQKPFQYLKPLYFLFLLPFLLVGASFFKQLLPAQYERLDIDGTPNKTGKTRKNTKGRIELSLTRDIIFKFLL